MSTEDVKVASRHLRGTLSEELATDTAEFGHDSTVVLKFHGIYQQDDRDVRRERTQQKLPLDYSCMVRASVPGGVISPEQWTALDHLADLTDGTLRMTTRQGVQFHVVHKGELRQLVRGINDVLLTTLAACGDVVRNTMACPFPDPVRQAVLAPFLEQLVRRFRPRTNSYWEVWVDGERAATVEPLHDDGPVEPIYGDAYLPRKFKIGFAWPGDNCIDVFSQDIGIVPTLTRGTSGDLTGFVVLAGGGMGMSHSRPDDTYPLLAQPVGWVPPGDLLDVVEAIVTTQRDFGNRDDRSRARLKYLLEERGVAWLRAQIVERTGRPLAEPVELPEWHVHDHHGWHGDVLGLPVPSGRVAGGYRDALRAVVDAGLVTELRITARQDVLLCGVTDHTALESTLRSHGVPLASDVSAVRRLSIACPALPTCGQALGEAERVLPDVVDALEKLLADTGSDGLPIQLNMTGCPNGCARPYSAEIGIVGRTKKNYDLYLGGSTAGNRLAQRVRADVPLPELVELLRPVLTRFAASGETEGFGDWCNEQGTDLIGTWLPAPTVRRRGRADGADADVSARASTVPA